MRKYLKTISLVFQDNAVYRFNNFLFIATQILIFGVFFYLWSSIYHQGGQIGNYTLNQLIFYYLTVEFLTIIFTHDIAQKINRVIQEGELSNFLVKPINYFIYNFAGLIGNIAYLAIMALLIFGIIFIGLNEYLNISFGLSNFFLFMLLAFLGFIIDFLFFYLIGVSTFWFGQIIGIDYSIALIINFLEGKIVPLDILPPFMINLSSWLPFKYLTFIPISVLNGRIEFSLSLVLIPLSWIIFLYLLNMIVFKIGLKKYEGFGA